MAVMKSVIIGILSGIAMVVITLSAAFISVYFNPQGGDSWDAVYFFTHPGFYGLFGTGFLIGYLVHRWRTKRRRSLG